MTDAAEALDLDLAIMLRAESVEREERERQDEEVADAVSSYGVLAGILTAVSQRRR